MNEVFSARILAWFDQHGRHDLPWQLNQTPYRVWISEIMLQQTQVATVIPYYERFMQQFPDIKSLAEAKLDTVLHHWTGLGYYARARNLHKTAKIVCCEHQASFPTEYDALVKLPGIGRSTAGAILSLAGGQRYPILDGNVKRVLCRYHGVEGWPGKKEVENQLWKHADQHTPADSFANYTQAIMDLGATICSRRKPQCTVCPVNEYCYAFASSRQHDFPASKVKTKLPKRETIFAIIENSNGEYLLEQRPPSGIWGGLWCFPEFSMDEPIADTIKKHYGYTITEQFEYDSFMHTFSHFQLLIKPVHIRVETRANRLSESGLSTWINPGADSSLGFPAPVVTLLESLNKN